MSDQPTPFKPSQSQAIDMMFALAPVVMGAKFAETSQAFQDQVLLSSALVDASPAIDVEASFDSVNCERLGILAEGFAKAYSELCPILAPPALFRTPSHLN